ncbi:MAG: hypothetical protein KME42_22655 [Tildeniella nuda ZEHNDER 1965/U140]|nr:hypothetical protein [Tildeniella nuda ZEHNDER 1965/U140]
MNDFNLIHPGRKQLAGLVAIASLLGTLLATFATSAHATPSPTTPIRLSQNRPGQAADFTQTFRCGQFRITLTGNMDSGRFTYRTSGLTLTRGTYDPSANIFSFRNSNYTYTLQDRSDGSGELEVIRSLPDGGYDLQVREECTVTGP